MRASPAGHPSGARDGAPAISVVVVSYRRSDTLEHVLHDLANQTGASFEVILVLQAYEDAVVRELEQRYGPVLSLNIRAYPHGLGVHGARNAALPFVRAPIVAFLDDDVRLLHTWVSALIPFYADPMLGGVGGFVRHHGCDRPAARWLRPLLGLSSRRYRIDWGGFHTMPWSSHPDADQPADWLSGCNMSFRMSALATAGLFDEAYGNYGYDDVDMGLRVRQAGWHLISSQRLRLLHTPNPKNRPSMADLIREEETRRVLFVRKAIGHRVGWRVRYAVRFGLHLPSILLQGLRHRTPSLVGQAIAGAWRGLQRYGR